jgi:RNA polymerase sigma-70 factor (ECF subfamily)
VAFLRSCTVRQEQGVTHTALKTDSFPPLAVILFVKMNLLELFDEHHAPLFRFAYRLTGSAADAEDIVQACFLELLRPDCSYDPKRAPLRTWLFGVVRNQCLKRFRQRTFMEVPETDDALSPEDEIQRVELQDAVRRAVLELPDTQREVLILAHYEQMPLAEIAGILDIEVAAVKSRLQRARATLRELLATYAPNAEQKQ